MTELLLEKIRHFLCFKMDHIHTTVLLLLPLELNYYYVFTWVKLWYLISFLFCLLSFEPPNCVPPKCTPLPHVICSPIYYYLNKEPYKFPHPFLSYFLSSITSNTSLYFIKWGKTKNNSTIFNIPQVRFWPIR